jgi:hypothetical protein
MLRHPDMTEPAIRDTTIYESHADLLTAVPITFLMKAGTLRLADGRLSFTRSRNRVVFDAPMNEIHSVGTNAFGITLWHKSTRYRFAIGQKYRAGIDSGVPVIAAVSAAAAIGDYRQARSSAADWASTLVPLQGSVPSGVAIRTPWPAWKTWAAIIGGITAVTAVIVTLTIAFSS